MATNHTANYNLNLWEANDKFVRDEFNQDNAKIDAALKAEADARAAADTAETNARIAADQDLENRKAAFVLLKEVNVTQQVSELSIDVSDIDWGAWQYVYMDIDLSGSGNFALAPNGNTNCYSSDSTRVGIAGSMYIGPRENSFRVRLETCKAPWRYVRATSKHISGYSNVVKFQDLTSLVINQSPVSSSYHITSGKVRFWGLA